MATTTYRQALNELLSLCCQVLGMELPWMQQIGCPPESKRISVVLTAREVQALLGRAGTPSGRELGRVLGVSPAQAVV